MSYSALLPNGSSISGSAYLERCTEVDEDGLSHEYVRLPIFERTAQKTFGAFLRIMPDAAKTWSTPIESLNLPTVSAAEGIRTYSVARTHGLEVRCHEVYGAYFKGGYTPAELCALFGLGTKMKITTGIDGYVSERFGAVTSWPDVTLEAKGRSFSLVSANTPLKGKYVAESGIVKFMGKIAFGNVTRTAIFVGVVMPGWVDCQCSEGFVERPFAAGTIYFTDYVRVGNTWQAVPRSAPMEMSVIE